MYFIIINDNLQIDDNLFDYRKCSFVLKHIKGTLQISYCPVHKKNTHTYARASNLDLLDYITLFHKNALYTRASTFYSIYVKDFILGTLTKSDYEGREKE